MTDPGDSFQVNEDSVVAKLAIDVPAGSADTLHQINLQAEQLKVNLTAVARAEEEWLEYLRQVPQLTEQAAQAQRNLITQLERTHYIQQELGGLGGGMAQGNRPGPVPYSTAAPPGYQNPFGGQQGVGGGQLGLGRGGGSQAEGVMQSMMQNDPRLFANVLAQRGMTPVTMGMGGANTTPASGGGQGQGAPAPGSSSPQATQRARDSAAPPDASQSGQPSTSEPQNIPSAPRPDAPGWQKALSQAVAATQSVASEARARGGGARGWVGAAASMAGSRLGGGDDDDDGGGGGGGGGLGGLGKGAGIAAGVGGILGGLKLMDKMAHGAGRQVQELKNLGGERGGGAVEGVGLEANARVMALNPFINMEQSRQIMQQALRSGYTGQEFDTLTGFMADNLKHMNMDAADSMKLFNDTVVGGKQSIESLKQQMKDIHDLSATGKVGQTEKIAQNVAAANVTGELGFTGASQRDMTTTLTEGFANNPILAHVAPEALEGAMQNDMFLNEMGRAAGISGALPDEIPDLLSEQGPGAAGNAMTAVLRKYAQRAHDSARGSETKAVSFFKSFINQLGVQLPGRREYKELYRSLMSGESPAQTGRDRVAAARGRQTLGEQTGIPAAFGELQHAGSAVGDFLTGDFSGAANNFSALFGGDNEGGGDINTPNPGEEGTAPRATAASSAYGPQGRAAPGLPNAPGAMHTSTSGQVNGELRVTVDQQGRVTAPQSVRLSGNQIAVNSGYGGATLNNPSPGDQNYLHANKGMG